MLDAGGKVLVDEMDLWPRGGYVTTLLLVNTTFLDAYPGTVKDLLTMIIILAVGIAIDGLLFAPLGRKVLRGRGLLVEPG